MNIHNRVYFTSTCVCPHVKETFLSSHWQASPFLSDTKVKWVYTSVCLFAKDVSAWDYVRLLEFACVVLSLNHAIYCSSRVNVICSL